MGVVHDSINDPARAFIEAQHMFFVATAPSGEEGHVNLSPKGYDTFTVLAPDQVAYLDLTGSGAETIAHLRQNGRITILFCAFEGSPNLLRLYGRGRVLHVGTAAFDDVASRLPHRPGVRAAIVVDVDRVATSCGYSVPYFSYEGERSTLDEWAERRGPDGLAAYHAERNATSIDGLPALD